MESDQAINNRDTEHLSYHLLLKISVLYVKT